jgi:hypothetical protein
MKPNCFLLAITLAPLNACASSRSALEDPTRAGSYVWGAEVNSFKPCGSDSVFWVLAPPDLLMRLRTAHDSLTTRPYERIYIRVKGHRSSEKTDGFAGETSGYFQITDILEIRRLIPGECGS